MTQELGPNTTDAVTDTALQNWQAMSPGIEHDIAQLALTSADTVLYQWDITQGNLTFSHNIGDVLPYPHSLPRHIDDWQQMIDPRDLQNWQETIQIWQTEGGTFDLRYRIGVDEDAVWVKHSALHQKGQNILVGAIAFNCTPPKQEADTLSTIKPALGNAEMELGKSLNAGEFISRLQHYQEQFANSREQSSVIVLAITSLPIIAQAFGQSAAETVMDELEKELRDHLNAGSLLYRIHRDQFGLIVPECDTSCAKKKIEALGEVVRDYCTKSSVGSVHTSSLCGHTSFNSNDADAGVIIDRAFTDLNRHPGMLYAALTQEPEDSMMARQQMGLANYLAKAMREDRLRLAYQPIIDSKTGEVAHYEALLRLVDDRGRISSAGALIPIAERMGLINIVDRKVLEMVVKELENYPDVHLAFNVSNLTTENPDWLAHIQSLLRDRPDIAARLTVEITETAAQRDLRRTAYFVAMVQDLGCLVSLDDFGSGYTSFRQLKTLSVDTVKIDGEFIRDLTDNPDNRFFVKTLLEFTELFGLKSVAEYVETGESAKLLMELGVDYLQGYYFGKPENQRSWLHDGEYKAS
ncbi:MAG: GGDEF domain-containing phosphodiesterase [Rickettsiales bacterium]|nr:GGDEF domain-containing phosphodiesterase [Rickettsiales bacterium]